MNYLVTGGAGFVGSRLAATLLGSGHAVRVLDNLSTGRRENLLQLTKYGERFGLVEDTIESERAVADAMRGVDAVFHLAAAVGVRRVHEDPLGTITTNVHGSEVVLAEATRRGLPTFIASSSEVYGRSPRELFHESDDLVIGSPHVGRWSYAASKVLDEFLALAYHRERGLPVTIGRLFNTTGPGQPVASGMVLPLFVSRALADEPIQVYGDGRQSRCFAHVDDVVSDIVGLMQTEDARGEVFNLGDDRPILIRDLAHLVVEITGSRSEVVLTPMSEAFDDSFEDIHRRRPDLRRVRDLLGARSPVPVAQIVADTAAWLASRQPAS